MITDKESKESQTMDTFKDRAIIQNMKNSGYEIEDLITLNDYSTKAYDCIMKIPYENSKLYIRLRGIPKGTFDIKYYEKAIEYMQETIYRASFVEDKYEDFIKSQIMDKYLVESKEKFNISSKYYIKLADMLRRKFRGPIIILKELEKLDVKECLKYMEQKDVK